MDTPKLVKVSLVPRDALVDFSTTALLLIDMQVDFLEPGGFGELLGNDVSKLQRAVAPCQRVLEAARQAGLLILHTREGHRPSLDDLHAIKAQRPGADEEAVVVIGANGPKGRILVRGEVGHDIIPELYPLSGESVIDKPGKGSFYATDLECILRAKGIRTLLVGGVTTEVCVHTTIREANDRGFHCIAMDDCCASYIDKFHTSAMEMVHAQGGLFGSVAKSDDIVSALQMLDQVKK